MDVSPLPLARVQLPESHPDGPGTCDVFGFLVRDGRECILVDTGVGSSPIIDHLYQPTRVPVRDALASVGASLDEVTAVVNSHLHFDHCGNNALFPEIPIFAQEAEREAAERPDYTLLEWVDFPGANYQLVAGRYPLSANLDLLPTPGHTPGHQSLVVGAGAEVDVVIAQAAYTADEFQRFLAGESDVPADAWSSGQYVDSLRCVRKQDPRRAYFSHDRVVWKREA